MSHTSVDYIAQLPHIQALPLKPVKLPGTDYIAGPTLFPGRVLFGYTAEPSQYNADTWAAVILNHAQSNAATSCVSYSAMNSGSTGGRSWFGYIFVGGPVDASDFVQGEAKSAVDGSRAYSIEAVSVGHAADITNIGTLPKSQSAPAYLWNPVVIPGPAYVPGSSIFPRNVVGAWDAHQDDFDTQEKWAAHVLKETQTWYPQATSCASYSAANASGKGRHWIGYSFIGVPITGDDFVRGDRDLGVRGAQAFAIGVVSAATSADDAHNVDFITKLPKFEPSQLPLKQIVLPGPDYIPGPYLFPGNIIAGYSADFAEYDQTSWAAYVLKHTQAYDAATSCASYSAINSGSSGGRFWFGYSFRGGPADGSDFVRGDIHADVRGAQAYSIEAVRINDLAFIAKFSKTKTEDALFKPVPLPGTNYVAGPTLFPKNVIAGTHADPQDYTADAWAKYVLNWTQTFPAATSCVSFSAINSGSTGGRYWFGYVFRGGPVTPSDFVTASDVEESFAFTI